MWSEAELDTNLIRAGLSDEELRKLTEELVGDERYVTLASLHGNDWAPGQVAEFASLSAQWANGVTKLTIHRKDYGGLELRREKTYHELVTTVVENIRSSRSTENWREKNHQ